MTPVLVWILVFYSLVNTCFSLFWHENITPSGHTACDVKGFFRKIVSTIETICLVFLKADCVVTLEFNYVGIVTESFFLNWRIIALPCCVSALQWCESAIGIHMSPPSWASFPLPIPIHPSRSSQDMELSSLCYTAAFPLAIYFTRGSIYMGRSPGERNGHLLQYSCLKNSIEQRSLAGCSPWGRRVGHDWATLT